MDPRRKARENFGVLKVFRQDPVTDLRSPYREGGGGGGGVPGIPECYNEADFRVYRFRGSEPLVLGLFVYRFFGEEDGLSFLSFLSSLSFLSFFGLSFLSTLSFLSFFVVKKGQLLGQKISAVSHPL